ncbi:MAG: hypothetical protein LRZ85_10200 [Alphaproteobacteria bacterium]|nr:hypothetical protein [Alphaproteobacteria bacterium]MCD8525812.1 hypothetical protein [Alphaproteobacteria bacterium]MCD8571431.1 hypothetical protein [Alphaproteobacteria bacterium]
MPDVTVLEVGCDSADLPEAVDHVLTKVQEALAVDQKIILMVGERHARIFDVRLAEVIRRGLQRRGTPNPVMLLEHSHNFLESHLSTIYPGQDFSFYQMLRDKLGQIKQTNPPYYKYLQTLALAGIGCHDTPATRLANLVGWLEDSADVRFVDLAMVATEYLDVLDPDTADIIKAHPARKKPWFSNVWTHAVTPDGMRLRNAYMAAQVEKVLAEDASRIVILQTGNAHVAGSERDKIGYEHSLHALFTQAAARNKDEQPVKLMTVIADNDWLREEGFFSRDARRALNNPDSIFLKDTLPACHRKRWDGRYLQGHHNEEIKALETITPDLLFDDWGSYERTRNACYFQLIDCLDLLQDSPKDPVPEVL